MSENFVFSSFQKPNRVTKNAALCVEERHALTVSRQTGGDLVFLVVVRINYGISLLCVPAEINDGHFMSGFIFDDADQSGRLQSLMDRDSVSGD